jgi:hypothetical protein
VCADEKAMACLEFMEKRRAVLRMPLAANCSRD